MNDRIMIIGCGGSGKSTLAKQLGEIMNIPVIHLDKLFWRSNWTSISKDEFDILLEKELKKDTWIIDGNFDRTIDIRLNACDTVIYLDYLRLVCLCGVIKRVIKNYGKTRPDMGENCPERFDLEFLKWTWNFNKTHRLKYLQKLNSLDHKQVIILKNRKQCKRFLESLNK